MFIQNELNLALLSSLRAQIANSGSLLSSFGVQRANFEAQRADLEPLFPLLQ